MWEGERGWACRSGEMPDVTEGLGGVRGPPPLRPAGQGGCSGDAPSPSEAFAPCRFSSSCLLGKTVIRRHFPCPGAAPGCPRGRENALCVRRLGAGPGTYPAPAWELLPVTGTSPPSPGHPAALATTVQLSVSVSSGFLGSTRQQDHTVFVFLSD